MLAGTVFLTVSGHETTLDFQGRELILKVSSLRSALAVARMDFPLAGMLGTLLRTTRVRVSGKISDRVVGELFPQPGRLVRWLSPTIRQML